MLAIINPRPDVLELAERAPLAPGPHQLLIRVRASGLNRADLHQRAGKYPAPAGAPSDIPGLEFAGEVRGLGEGATRWRIGDRVMGLVGGGAQANELVLHEDEAMAIPDALNFAEGAAIPEAFLTAWDALLHRAATQVGERVLMHAIGSGVGTAAIQLCKLFGFDLVGTSRTSSKLAQAKALGLESGVLLDDQWVANVPAPINVIIDPLGAAMLEPHIAMLAPQGRLVVLGTMTGARADGIDLGAVLRKRLHIVGTAMRVRSGIERIALATQFTQDILPHFSSGALRPVIDSEFAAREFDSAYQRLAGNASFGKVLLRWD